MTYKVFYTDRFKSNLRQHIRHLVDQHVSAKTIEHWYSPLLDNIDQLYEMPRLYAVDEPYSQRVGYEVRKLTYKNYIIRYRVR